MTGVQTCALPIYELGKAFKISYAHGCAFSSDYENCTLRTLFDKADKNMYNNKQAEKAGR